jgi:hemolysin III
MLSLDLQKNPEEAANTVTHGLGAVAGFLAGTALVALAARSADVYQLISACVYSLSLITLYTASTLFHWEQDARIKRRLELFDHCAIFLLIAGTYTPFLLVTLRDSVGWGLLAVIWGLAVAGMIFKLIFATRFRLASTLLYLAMGWLIVVAAEPMLNALTMPVVVLLVSGGVAYTIGTYFFCNEERLPYAHTIWHLFVLAGSICHFLAVASQVLPG